MATSAAANTGLLTYRHSAVVRLTHWINVVCLLILLLSGLQIFNAHPALYWGETSNFEKPLMEIGIVFADEKMQEYRGQTTVLGKSFDTTGVLGMSKDKEGRMVAAAFPHWLILPEYRSLALGRLWHFFFAWVFVINGIVYLVAGFRSGHFRRGFLPDYNLPQKIAYFIVVFVLLPAMVLAGLSMSPAVNAALPWLSDLFGGRQSARTVHFAVANLLLAFVVGHIILALVKKPLNNLRSMVTGYYKIRLEADERKKA